MGALCSMHERNEKFIHDFDQKLEGKRSLGRTRRRWEETIRMDLREIGR
jgi:hypothetical protein